MLSIQTTAFLLDAAQAAAEAAENGIDPAAPLTLIPIAVGTICGIGIAGFFMHHAAKRGEQDRRTNPNRFKRLK